MSSVLIGRVALVVRDYAEAIAYYTTCLGFSLIEAPPRWHWAWANLMRRAFDVDVLACPRCGGRLRLIGTVEDPKAIGGILANLALPTERVDRAPPPAASAHQDLAARA